jgi:hypothetical protein
VLPIRGARAVNRRRIARNGRLAASASAVPANLPVTLPLLDDDSLIDTAEEEVVTGPQMMALEPAPSVVVQQVPVPVVPAATGPGRLETIQEAQTLRGRGTYGNKLNPQGHRRAGSKAEAARHGEQATVPPPAYDVTTNLDGGGIV